MPPTAPRLDYTPPPTASGSVAARCTSGTLWKYPLAPKARSVVAMPRDARILHVGVIEECLCLWAEADPSVATTPRTFERFLIRACDAVSKVEMPVGAQVISVREEGVALSVLVELDPTAATETRTFVLLMTGEAIPAGYEHLATLFLRGGSVPITVAHLYQPARPRAETDGSELSLTEADLTDLAGGYRINVPCPEGGETLISGSQFTTEDLERLANGERMVIDGRAFIAE
jgi:hypothetical protein